MVLVNVSNARQNIYSNVFGYCFFLLFLISCKDSPHVGQKAIVTSTREINKKAEEVIHVTIRDLLNAGTKLEDSIQIKNTNLLDTFYRLNNDQLIWSAEGKFRPIADSLMGVIDSSRYYGLFPKDYYQSRLHKLFLHMKVDTSKETRLDASNWALGDLLLTSAFVQLIHDLKLGRLPLDSAFMANNALTSNFLQQQLNYFGEAPVDSFMVKQEPANKDYLKLRMGLRSFLKKARFKNYTPVKSKDSTQLPLLAYKRISEEDSSVHFQDDADTAQIKNAIIKYQKHKGIKADGKLTESLINRLNDNDREKFIRIAITLDKYKALPVMPEQYVWVNIPSYYLELRDKDSMMLRSRIVVGKPLTRTPIITSSISNMVTYPQWHIPESIIKKEILPGLQKDPGYTKRKGFSLVDEKGNEVDPYKVNWSKYKNSIPYNVVQGSGDENALGIMKFNFPNKFAVYLHDTNQRYLFSNSVRDLSHGCVRVQAWKQLADFIIRNDSTLLEKDSTLKNLTPIDSVNSWLQRKEKHVIIVRRQLPLFIRYFTCEGKENKIVFYEDIYGEDRKWREKYFSDK